MAKVTYTTVGSNKLEEAKKFYDALMESIGVPAIADHPSGGRVYGGADHMFGVLGPNNKEAATVYNQLLSEKILPEREEEISQRWTNALHLMGDYNESDKACLKFHERFPQSTLTPAVLFVYAENSFFRIVAAEKTAQAEKRTP